MSNVLDILASDKIQVIKQGDNTFIKYNLLKTVMKLILKMKQP